MRRTGTFGFSTSSEVPGDRLALAVLVRREQELVGVLQLALQVGDDLLLVGVDDVVGLEAVVDATPRAPYFARFSFGTSLARLGRSRMWPMLDSTTKSVAEVAGDGLRLRGALDDHELLRHGA